MHSDLGQSTSGQTSTIFLALRRVFNRLKRVLEEARSANSPSDPAVTDVYVSRGSSLVFWPRDLLPRELPDCRVLTWGYDVDIDHTFSSASTATIFNQAGNLLTALTDARLSSIERERPLVFVAHSLGGIVVKDVRNLKLSITFPVISSRPITFLMEKLIY